MRAEVREARLGVGSVGLVRWGRKEKVTGKERAWEAAALAAETRAAGGSGQRRETKRESLMVRPVVQSAAYSAVRAAARAQSSRWPRQRETARPSGTAAVWSESSSKSAAEWVRKHRTSHPTEVSKELHEVGIALEGDLPASTSYQD